MLSPSGSDGLRPPRSWFCGVALHGQVDQRIQFLRSTIGITIDESFGNLDDLLSGCGGIAGCKFRKACCRFPRCCFVFTQSDPRMTSERRRKMAKNVICLWYDGTAEEAARFYAQTFPDSAVTAVHRAPGDYPDGKERQVLTVEFTVLGVACLGLNGARLSSTVKPFRFRSSPRTRPRPIATGMPSSAMAAPRARAGGARTNGACPGRSPHAYCWRQRPILIVRPRSARSRR